MKKFLLVFILLSFISLRGYSAEPGYTIAGPTLVHAGDQDIYSVAPVDGLNYIWTVTGGDIVRGQGTPFVTVNWITPDAHSLHVQVVQQDNTIVVIDENSL